MQWLGSALVLGILSVLAYRYFFKEGSSYASLRSGPKDLDEAYDFIIVGAGSSGSVLAARLTEASPQIKVLLIERGGQASIGSYVPILAPLQGLFDVIWGYESEQQKYSHFGYKDQKSRITRGQGLGGSGHLNYHIFSNETFKSCSPQRRKRIRAKGYPFEELSESKILNESLGNAFLSEESRYPGWTFEAILQGIVGGKRYSNLDAYLRPAMNRANLHVLLSSEVNKIEFKDKAPRSLNVLYHGYKENPTEFQINVASKLILAGGAINTPKLLFESGVGPKEVIANLNLSLVQDLPIGLELQDHLTCPLYFHLSQDTGSVNLANLLNPFQLWNYLVHKKGIYSTSALSVQATDPEKDIVILIYNVGAPHKDIYIKLSGMRPDIFDETFPSNTNPWKKGFILLAGCSKPQSKGRISMHHNGSLSIDPNYLHASSDLQCAVRALRTAVDIGSGKSFKTLGASLHLPKYEECKDLEASFENDKYVECVARTSCMTKYHPASTTLLDIVVDGDFMIKGMKNIYIVDGGVLPRGSFMYPNSVITDMAECASESFLEKF